ncbi:MAG: amino acid kinase family protein, partial [Thermoanaerobaculia bacterium]
KDFASSLLAADLKADVYIVLTNVAQVAIDFNRPTQRALDRITVEEAEKHLAAGQFPAGSMGPKIEAAIQFVRSSGKDVLITDVESVRDALDGKGGTWIVP